MFRAHADGFLQGQGFSSGDKFWHRLFKSPQQSNGEKKIFLLYLNVSKE